jgi:hypothetical protein
MLLLDLKIPWENSKVNEKSSALNTKQEPTKNIRIIIFFISLK